MKLLILFCLTSQIFNVRASELLCPEGSICTKEQLKTYKALNSAFIGTNSKIKAEFIKNKGFPIKYLINAELNNTLKPVSWNSRCENHKKDKLPFWFKAEEFSTKITPTEGKLYPKAELKDKSYFIPYDVAPIYIENDKLIYLFDVLENYLELSIDNLGNIAFHESKFKEPIQSAENMTCPEDLKKSSSKEFLFSICQKLWDKNLKRFEMVRYDWGCL